MWVEPPREAVPAERHVSRAQRTDAHRTPVAWRRFLFLILLFVVVGIGGAVRLLAALPIPEPVGADETSIVFDRHGTPIAHLHAEQNRIPVSLEQVTPALIDAVIASEDRDYFRHPGVDPVAIGRAAWVDIRQQGELQGGSTITQQYVKNAFLDADRTLIRKLREAVLAIKIERELSKEEILERYLNVIYFGRGAYGVEAASQVWFGMSASELDIGRAAYLAALIRAPELADVSRPAQAELARQRRNGVLVAMFEEGYITEGELLAARSTDLEAVTLPREENSSVQVLIDDVGLEHPLEMVRRELIARYGAARVFAGGLRVTTTIDLDAQRSAFAAARSVTDRDGAPEVAVVALDDQGHIRALVGGSDFSVSQVNLATGVDGGGGGRQPGSVAKTIAVVAALEQGFEMTSLLAAPAEMVVPAADGGDDWTVRDSRAAERGSIPLSTALEVSSNTAFATLSQGLDLESLVEVSARLGVTAELRPFPSLVLGAQEVAVLDMAAAYSTIARGGERRSPAIVMSVTDQDESFDERWPSDRGDGVDSRVADDVTVALRAVVETGTGRAAAVPGLAISGKTGTSQENRDAWFVGWSDRFTVAVWMGFPDDGRPMVDILGLPAITGGSFPATIFSQVMAGLHEITADDPADLDDATESTP